MPKSDPTNAALSSERGRTERSPFSIKRGLVALLAATYPVLIYLGMTQWSPRIAGFLVFGAAAFALVWNLNQQTRATALKVAAPLLPALFLGLIAGLTDDPRLLLALPSTVSLLLLIPFLLSLRAGSTPIIERFATLHRQAKGLTDPLPDSGVAHCRRFTLVWVVFLFVNGSIAAFLALVQWTHWWLVYTCGLSYAVMACLVIVEKWNRPQMPQLTPKKLKSA